MATFQFGRAAVTRILLTSWYNINLTLSQKACVNCFVTVSVLRKILRYTRCSCLAVLSLPSSSSSPFSLEVGSLYSSYEVWGDRSAVSSASVAKNRFCYILAVKSDIWWQ